jgi:chemotaxis protein MotB
VTVTQIDAGENEAGEGYFASVSDLMVGILFVFLLMLTVFALNFRDAEDSTKVERARYEEALREIELQRAEIELQKARAIAAEEQFKLEEQRAIAAQIEAERLRQEAERQRAKNEELRGLLQMALARIERDIEDRYEARKRLLGSVQRALTERGVRVEVDERSGVLRLAGDLLFSTGSAVLGAEARRTVQTLGEVLAQILPCHTKSTHCTGDPAPILEALLVEGHTDRQPFVGNDRLSTDRALTVFAELRRSQQGLDDLRNPEDLRLSASQATASAGRCRMRKLPPRKIFGGTGGSTSASFCPLVPPRSYGACASRSRRRCDESYLVGAWNVEICPASPSEDGAVAATAGQREAAHHARRDGCSAGSPG